jgi:flagellin
MSNVVLSASVRQNLLSLQNTAALLATTQERLASGKKVNTALDNPTNFFTAQGLDNRASDIANLLDSVSNGVQILQAANTGITSLEKLVDTAKSIANQVLQSPTGYAPKSTVTGNALPGATSSALLAPLTTSGNTLSNQAVPPVPITAATTLSGLAGSNSLSPGFAATNSFTVNGFTFTFVAGAVSTQSGPTSFNIGVGDTVGNLLNFMDTATGGSHSIASNGAITLTGAVGVALGGANLAPLGLAATGNSLIGQTLTVAATAGGTPTNLTFGFAAGQISTLAELNTTLAANNLQATIDTTGRISITTSNDAASSTVGALGGTSVTTAGAAFNGVTISPPVPDINSQNARANLVQQYNNVMEQINTTAQDASYNGINLLNGDTLRLVFNETGRSTLTIQGVTLNDAGLGLAPLTTGVDFLDSGSANAVLNSLNSASTTLRAEASTLGSNLSIVEIRQDFSKNLINVLQTGSSNLTLADANEEAANSQALSTRQSIAVSALALANQSQASVLQLLR